MNSETKEQQSPADQLHWSFSDGPNLTKVVFPTGFSSSESTLPAGDFDPLADWEQAYDVIFPGFSNTPSPSAAHIYFGSLRLAARFDGDQVRLVVREVRQLGQDFSVERQVLEARFTCCREPLFPLEADRSWSVKTRLINCMDPATKSFCPARTSWWTGCYSSEHGVVMNGVPCHADTPGISTPPFSAWFNSAPTAPTYSPRPLDALRACLGRTLPAAAVW